jgi:hypothetical protein
LGVIPETLLIALPSVSAIDQKGCQPRARGSPAGCRCCCLDLAAPLADLARCRVKRLNKRRRAYIFTRPRGRDDTVNSSQRGRAKLVVAWRTIGLRPRTSRDHHCAGTPVPENYFGDPFLLGPNVVFSDKSDSATHHSALDSKPSTVRPLRPCAPRAQ